MKSSAAGIARGADAGRGGVEVVGGLAELDVGPEDGPERAGTPLVGHADAARVEQAVAADPAVEAHVRVAADHDVLLHVGEDLRDALGRWTRW